MFEPNPVFAKELRRKTQDSGDRVEILNLAIGSEETELHYYYDTQSFVSVSNVGTISKYRSTKPIPVVTLNEFFRDEIQIDFLKTDIEEMDYFALLGASNLLPNISFLQFELGLGLPLGDIHVQNSHYWSLLEPHFDLYLLRDENPIWKTYPDLPLLLVLDSKLKMTIEILQSTGTGFNIVGINRNQSADKLLDNVTGSLFHD